MAESPQPAEAERPKVVVIVLPREAPQTAAPGSGPLRRPSGVVGETPAKIEGTPAPAAVVTTPVVHDAGDHPTDLGSLPARPPAEGDRPTERIRKQPRRQRTAEDDKTIAAVIPLDFTRTPNPLSDFLGRTLLFRAARAALVAGAPRLILLGNVDEARQREVYEQAYAGFGGKPVELRSGDPRLSDFGRGRVLILDAAALHDPEAVRRLATRAHGDTTTLLLTKVGDGVRVRTEDGRVREVGVDPSAADGVMAGAASVPVEHFERMTQLGERAALEEMSASDQLVGIMSRLSYAQQLHTKDAYTNAKVLSYDAITTGGATSGLFEDVIGKPVSRWITAVILHRRFVTPSRVSVLAGVLALVGAFLLMFSAELPLRPLAYGAFAMVLAGVFLIASAILDRTDGELARLRLEDDEDARYLDFGLDHVAHMVVFAALAWAVDPPDRAGLRDSLGKPLTAWGRFMDSAPSWLAEPLQRLELDDPMRVGIVALFGVVVLMCVLLWRGAPRPDSSGLVRVADGLASAFNSRDYFYLLTVAALFNLIPLMAGLGLMAWFLVATAALVHLTWLLIFLFSLVSHPLPAED